MYTFPKIEQNSEFTIEALATAESGRTSTVSATTVLGLASGEISVSLTAPSNAESAIPVFFSVTPSLLNIELEGVDIMIYDSEGKSIYDFRDTEAIEGTNDYNYIFPISEEDQVFTVEATAIAIGGMTSTDSAQINISTPSYFDATLSVPSTINAESAFSINVGVTAINEVLDTISLGIANDADGSPPANPVPSVTGAGNYQFTFTEAEIGENFTITLTAASESGITVTKTASVAVDDILRVFDLSLSIPGSVYAEEPVNLGMTVTMLNEELDTIKLTVTDAGTGLPVEDIEGNLLENIDVGAGEMYILTFPPTIIGRDLKISATATSALGTTNTDFKTASVLPPREFSLRISNPAMAYIDEEWSTTISMSRAGNAAGLEVVISDGPTVYTYPVSPIASSNTITHTFPAGDRGKSFGITATATSVLGGTESISSSVFVIERSQTTLPGPGTSQPPEETANVDLFIDLVVEGDESGEERIEVYLDAPETALIGQEVPLTVTIVLLNTEYEEGSLTFEILDAVTQAVYGGIDTSSVDSPGSFEVIFPSDAEDMRFLLKATAKAVNGDTASDSKYITVGQGTGAGGFSIPDSNPILMVLVVLAVSLILAKRDKFYI